MCYTVLYNFLALVFADVYKRQTTFFAQLEKTSASQKEYLEKIQEKKAAEKKEAKKKEQLKQIEVDVYKRQE